MTLLTMTDSEKKSGIKGIPIIDLMISGRDSLASNLKPKEKPKKTNMIQSVYDSETEKVC